MMKLRKAFVWIIVVIVAIALGIGIGMYMNREKLQRNNSNNVVYDNLVTDNLVENGIEISEASAIEEEKTTPNTLMIYKTYYTKCQHYINEYQNIDASDVNLNQEDLQEKYREWSVTSFEAGQVVLEREENDFCNEHYRLKLEDGKIVIYQLDEDENETEYEQTEIASEYLTEEDILKLKEGITVYGKENLMAVLEDYE